MAAKSKSAKRLYLVDGSSYIFRAYHALPPLTRKSDGLPVGAVSGFCNMLWKLLEELKAGRPIVLVDDWAEVTPAKLEQWWAELSPRLEAARWVGTNRGMDSLLNGSCWRPQAGATAVTPITDRNESLWRWWRPRARRRGAAPDGT